jgi:hypothetical protein
MRQTSFYPPLHNSLRAYLFMGGLIALLLVIAASAGIFMPNFYSPFATKPSMVAGLLVQDLVSLLAAPLLVGAMIATVRGSRRGFVLWNSVLVYTVYYFSFYVFGNFYTVIYPLYLALLGLGVYSLIGLLAGANLASFVQGADAKMPVRTLAVILLIALLFVPLWAVILVQDIQAQQPRDTALVFVLDLCFLLPAIAIAAVQLWQRRPFGYLLSGILLFKAAVSGILLAVSTLWGAQLGLQFAPEELGMYLFLTVAGSAGFFVYLRHLHDDSPARASSPAPSAAG